MGKSVLSPGVASGFVKVGVSCRTKLHTSLYTEHAKGRPKNHFTSYCFAPKNHDIAPKNCPV